MEHKMILTNKQEEGLKIAIDRFKQKEKYTVISGYAGTGKSTLVKFIIAALEPFGILPEDDVCYATFTGKAAQVLLKKGNHNVLATYVIHSNKRTLINLNQLNLCIVHIMNHKGLIG